MTGSLDELKSGVNKDPLLVVALRASSKPDECLSWHLANDITKSEQPFHGWYSSEIPTAMLEPFRAFERAWANGEVARAAVAAQDALPIPPRASVADQKRAYQTIAPAQTPSAWSRIKSRRFEVAPHGPSRADKDTIRNDKLVQSLWPLVHRILGQVM